MALFWIVHEKDGKRRILIQEGSTLIFARLDAAMAGFDGDFIGAHRLDDKRAKKVPKNMIGRLLTDREVSALLDRMSLRAGRSQQAPGAQHALGRVGRRLDIGPCAARIGSQQLLDEFDHPPRYDGTEPFGEHVRGVAKRHELRAVVEHEHVRELVRRVGRRGIGRRHGGEFSAGDDRRQTGPHFALARPLVLISGRRLPGHRARSGAWVSPPARRGKVGPPGRHGQHPGGLHQAP